MDEHACGPMPTAINLHSRSRMLEIAFADGARFELPCEYLRVFSPAAEVRAAQARGEVISGKEQVNITGIIPVGSYAIQLQFDDGHDTGIYSWKTLHDLGLHRSRYWAEYLQGLERAGHRRETPRRDPGTPLRLQVLYFATLAEKLGLTVEEVAVPGSVQDVASLLRRFITEK